MILSVIRVISPDDIVLVPTGSTLILATAKPDSVWPVHVTALYGGRSSGSSLRELTSSLFTLKMVH